jgi:hypothetical protein
VLRRISLWLLFGVAAALLPFLPAWFGRELADDVARPPTWEGLFGHGELLLVAVAIAFPAIGMLLASGAAVLVRAVLGGVAVLLLFVTASFYGAVDALGGPVDVARVSQAEPNGHVGFVIVVSAITFVAILIVACACVAVARDEADATV